MYMYHSMEIAKLMIIALFQILQSLNLMDYSLLVGIHDCTIPAGELSDFEDYSDDDDNSGEECTDLPLSPSNTGELTNLAYWSIVLNPFSLTTCT